MKTDTSIISVAPMMDWTDRHCRYFHRLLSPNAYLYTEMVTTGALIHGDIDRHLLYNKEEHPVALQLGGNDPEDLAKCSKIGEEYGYNEINLNCGCPSDRVQSGAFGACLMAEPKRVAECIDKMSANTSIPVTVKCRIGIDDSEDYEFLDTFVSTIKQAGCKTFIIHARKAWLKGLSPKENREIPPLKYHIVEQLKQNHPNLNIHLNGGIDTIEKIDQNIKKFDGIMIGRKAYQVPTFLADIEQKIFNKNYTLDYELILEKMALYADQQKNQHGTPLKSIARHMTGLFHGKKGTKHWKRSIAERAFKEDVSGNLFTQIYKEIRDQFDTEDAA